MRVIIQRSKESIVIVDNKTIGKINNGFVIFAGFNNTDTLEDIKYIVNKVIKLRIFDDEKGIMNLSIKDVNGSILSISQFTLYADTKEGNRPNYIQALNREDAIKLYDIFNEELRKENIIVETGIFGEDMKVNIINDGPVTIIIDSKEKSKQK